MRPGRPPPTGRAGRSGSAPSWPPPGPEQRSRGTFRCREHSGSEPVGGVLGGEPARCRCRRRGGEPGGTVGARRTLDSGCRGLLTGLRPESPRGRAGSRCVPLARAASARRRFSASAASCRCRSFCAVVLCRVARTVIRSVRRLSRRRPPAERRPLLRLLRRLQRGIPRAAQSCSPPPRRLCAARQRVRDDPSSRGSAGRPRPLWPRTAGTRPSGRPRPW